MIQSVPPAPSAPSVPLAPVAVASYGSVRLLRDRGFWESFLCTLDASVNNLAVHTHPAMGMVVTLYPKERSSINPTTIRPGQRDVW